MRQGRFANRRSAHHPGKMLVCGACSNCAVSPVGHAEHGREAEECAANGAIHGFSEFLRTASSAIHLLRNYLHRAFHGQQNRRTLTLKRTNYRNHPKQTLGDRRVASPCGKLHSLPRGPHSLGPHRGHLRPREGAAVRAAPLRCGRGSSGSRRRGFRCHQARAVCCPGNAKIEGVSPCVALFLKVAERKD